MISDRRWSLNGAVAVAALLGTAPALAQNPAAGAVTAGAQVPAVDEEVAPGDILVTARKREESLQEVPLAITAFTARQIEDARIQNVEDVARLTPGFTFTPLFGGNQSTPVIRGLSTTIGEPNVGFFVDGVYQSSRSVMDSLLGDDIVRIEVVKGPQSALYGRNTFGGAINYITRSPTNDLAGGVRATVGNYDQRELRASLSGPLATDRLFFSVGGSLVRNGGFFDNTLTGRDLDRYDSRVVTGGLEYRSGEGLRVRLRAGYEETDQRDFPIRFAINDIVPARPAGPAFPAAFQLVGGVIEPFDTFAVTPGFNDRRFLTSSLAVDLDVGDHTLTSITGYTNLDFRTATDLDYEARRIRYQTLDQDQDEYSQELRLASPGDRRISYLAGAYYYRVKSFTIIDDRIEADAAPLAAAIPAGLRRQLQGGVVNRLDERTESFALFAQVIARATDRLSFSVEGRQTWETKRVDATDIAQFGGAVGRFDDRATFRNFTPRFTVDYQASPSLLLYGIAANAVKVGGFNVVTTTGAILADERSYDPERSWNYELGVKSTLLGGALTLNADVFLIKWRDQIVRALGQTLAVLNANAGRTTSKGVELEARLRPVAGLEVGAGLAVTDAEYDRYTFGALTGLGLDPVLDGRRLQYVSKYTANGSVQYTYPVRDGLELFGRADASYQSKQSAVQPANSFIGAATLVNAQLGFNAGVFEVRGFVENLTKEDSSPAAVYLPSASARFDFVRGAARAGPATGFQAFGGAVQARRPRTYGLTLGYRF